MTPPHPLLELFQKFITFGDAILPLSSSQAASWWSSLWHHRHIINVINITNQATTDLLFDASRSKSASPPTLVAASLAATILSILEQEEGWDLFEAKHKHNTCKNTTHTYTHMQKTHTNKHIYANKQTQTDTNCMLALSNRFVESYPVLSALWWISSLEGWSISAATGQSIKKFHFHRSKSVPQLPQAQICGHEITTGTIFK